MLCAVYKYLVVLVDVPHPVITFIWGNNFTRVLDNDLIRLKSPIASDAITTINCLDEFYADVVLSTNPTSLT